MTPPNGVIGQNVSFFRNFQNAFSSYRSYSSDSCILIRKIPSTKVTGLKIHPGSFGVTGVKRSFSQKKCYNLFMLHSKTMGFIHVHYLETLYLCYGVKGQLGVIWGHRGQILISTKNALSPSMLHSLSMLLKHMHQLDPFYKTYWLKY